MLFEFNKIIMYRIKQFSCTFKLKISTTNKDIGTIKGHLDSGYN